MNNASGGFMVPVVLIVGIILTILCTQNSDLSMLSVYSLDEWSFLRSITTIWRGLITFDLQLMFSYSFFTYGFGYFFLALAISSPFLALDMLEPVVVAGRLLSSVSALFILAVGFRLIREGTNALYACLFVLLLLSMPGYWLNAIWFHPDSVMSAFLLLTIVLFFRDEGRLGRSCDFAGFALALAIGVKFQAITFLPAWFAYFGLSLFLGRTSLTALQKLLFPLRTFAAIAVIFVAVNPYLLHPKGIAAWLKMFLFNLENNATNNGQIGQLTVGAKYYGAVAPYFAHWSILVLAFTLSSIYLLRAFKERSVNLAAFGSVYLYCWSNFLYLLLAFNKDWHHYYLPVCIAAVFLLTVTLAELSKTISGVSVQRWILPALAAYHFLMLSPTWVEPARFNLNGNLASSRGKQILVREFLREKLAQIPTRGGILISPYTGFDFHSLGFNFNDVQIVFGPLRKEMVKENIEIIVIRKDDTYFDPPQLAKSLDRQEYLQGKELIDMMSHGALGFVLFAENGEILVLRRNSLEEDSGA